MTKVNWYYCQYCKKDVETELKIEIDEIHEYRHAVTASVFAICAECGGQVVCSYSEMIDLP
jgi:uncharacterized protein with PIN domain